MKKIFLYGALALSSVLMTGCNDFLDENRYPLDEQTNNPEFWNNASNVDGQIYTFYNNFTGYGNGGGQGLFYFKTLSDDQAGGSFANWTNTSVPASSSNWSSPFVEIRRANYIIENVNKSTLSKSVKNHYEGVARLNRAYQYYQLVRMYGDVQWIGGVVDPADKDVVYGSRTDRDEVMDSVLFDLDFACATITGGSKITFNKDMAQAMKSEICLYEGTYSRYRTLAENGKAANEERAKKYLGEAVKASEAVMNAGYTLSNDYHALYNSTSLTGNSEIIFCKPYNSSVLKHSLISYTASSTQINGMTKDAFDAYLFKDGKPLALTTENKSDVGEVDENGNYSIAKLLEVRDARLAATIDPVVYYDNMTWSREGSMEMTSSTGYGVCKYDNVTLPLSSRINTGSSYTSAPLYWLAVIYLNYAEAKAELGTLTQEDVNNTIGKLYTRAELPVLNISAIEHDPANNMGVSDLLWEIRRCRRCELMFDNWTRYWDLVRWHKLDLLDSQKNPNILLGANMTACPPLKDSEGNAYTIPNVGGYIDGSKGKVRVYDKRQYLYPVPSGQITLNENLTQNPLWETAE